MRAFFLFLRSIFLRLLFAISLATSGAAAQTRPGTEMPDALKNVKPASGVCSRDDVTQGIGQSARANNIRPDMSCAIKTAELAALLEKPDTTVVDLRSPAEYSAIRIDGSLNITASALRAKNYLHEKSIVLMGNGKTEREIYIACADLRAQGFKQVKVLQGGMPAWLGQNQKVVGRDGERAPSIELTASELWIESQFDANLIVVTKKREEMLRFFSFATSIADESPAAVKAVMERWRKEFKNSSIAAVVLVTSSQGAEVETMQRLRQAIQPVPLLVYVGTLDAFEKQIAQQKAVWAAQARGPKQPGCGL